MIATGTEQINQTKSSPTPTRNDAKKVSPQLAFGYDSGTLPSMQQLQHTIGNQAVLQLLRSRALQCKLTIGQPGDRYEQEADRVADQVMRMPEPTLQRQSEDEEEKGAIVQASPIVGRITPWIQRKPELDEEQEEPLQAKFVYSGPDILQRQTSKDDEEEETVQAKSASQTSLRQNPDFETSIHHLRGGGEPLPRPVRDYFEPRFGYDFSGVRVHTDSRAVESARKLNARAFTIGKDLVFGTGQYAPEHQEGKKLLAHELAHVAQQNSMLMIARQIEKARSYQPEELRPHIPRVPPVNPPPDHSVSSIKEDLTHKVEKEKQRSSDIIGETEDKIRNVISKSYSRLNKENQAIVSVNVDTVEQVDQAIRLEFGHLLSPDLKFTAKNNSTVSLLTPDEFGKAQIRNAQDAYLLIGKVALEASSIRLRNLGITKPDDPRLQKEVAVPLFKKLGIDLLREYQKIHIGGEVVDEKGKYHAIIPNKGRYLGNIMVHEAMHYYEHVKYFQMAIKDSSLERKFREGGAEFLARHVIRRHLSHNPKFQINYNNYSDEINYVSNSLLRGGLSSFALAYFQGHVDLLGL